MSNVELIDDILFQLEAGLKHNKSMLAILEKHTTRKSMFNDHLKGKIEGLELAIQAVKETANNYKIKTA